MDYIKAFIIGGGICVIAQLLIDYTKLTAARILVIYVCLGTILTYAGIYGPLVDFAGAGATIPLTGFGYVLAKGAMTGANENGLMGAFLGGVKASTAGITAAVVFGYIAALLSRSRMKK